MKALRGTEDLISPKIELWQFIENTTKTLFSRYHYSEIRTPLIEELSLFARSVGSTSDIVTKQMFHFKDRSDNDIALRPEATAGVVRAYIEGGLSNKKPLHKFYYIGPMFRSERPQAGRRRQFHQVGAEVLGSYSAFTDAEVIALMCDLLRSLGIDGFTVKINSLGCKKDQARFSELIKKNLKESRAHLCDDCKVRLEKNPLRVLDCKNKPCQTLFNKSIAADSSLCEDCAKHFEDVKNTLAALKIPYSYEPHMVRGLDYYTKTVFEITHPGLGAQDALGAGGRYDNLVEELGGPATGAIGFAMGIERIAMVLGEDKMNVCAQKLHLFIATLGKAAVEKAFVMADTFRKEGFCVEVNHEEKSLKAQLRYADSQRASLCILIGDNELKDGTCIVKDMKKGSQETIPFDQLNKKIREAFA
jgi:histidyl-tRNA synthetase